MATEQPIAARPRRPERTYQVGYLAPTLADSTSTLPTPMPPDSVSAHEQERLRILSLFKLLYRLNVLFLADLRKTTWMISSGHSEQWIAAREAEIESLDHDLESDAKILRGQYEETRNLNVREGRWRAPFRSRLEYMDRERSVGELASENTFISKIETLLHQLPPPRLMTDKAIEESDDPEWYSFEREIDSNVSRIREFLVEVRQKRLDLETEVSSSSSSMVAHAYPESKNRIGTMTAIICAVSLGCTIPVFVAWSRFPNAHGTTQDADFWMLLQSTVMQLLNLLTIIYPASQKSLMHWRPWFWAWMYAMTSCLCLLAATALYVLVPVKWSAVLSFGGSVAQALLILQFMQVVGKGGGPGGDVKTRN